MKDNYAYILDYLPEGHPSDALKGRGHPTIQAVTEEHFNLLELHPRNGVTFSIGDKIYIGPEPEERTIIDKINRRVTYQDLTPSAHGELPFIIEDNIKEHEQVWVDRLNTMPLISNRMHTLELLPGIGKKKVEHIVEERRKQPFKNFQDATERTHIHNYPHLFMERIIEELQEPQKYYLFTQKPYNPTLKHHN